MWDAMKTHIRTFYHPQRLLRLGHKGLMPDHNDGANYVATRVVDEVTGGKS
jgi:hypothetical protein